jgi:hypothetical protein
MAGSPGTLTGRGCAPALAAAGLLVLLGGYLRAGERTGDVLIAEHAERLVLFNKYQQRLSPEEERRFPPFVPMIMRQEHDVLGDGFTPCMSVEVDGEPLYILRLADGTLSVRGETGKTEIFRNVSILGDTVIILRGKALRMRPAGGKAEILLKGGQRVVRMFESGGSTYVGLPGSPARFGWLTLSAAARLSEWREGESDTQAGFSPSDIFARVRPVVDGANRSLRRIYAALTQESGGAPAPPSFRLSRSRTEIRCNLEGAPGGEAFDGSRRALFSEIGRALGGTGLHAEMSDSAIIIPLR